MWRFCLKLIRAININRSVDSLKESPSTDLYVADDEPIIDEFEDISGELANCKDSTLISEDKYQKICLESIQGIKLESILIPSWNIVRDRSIITESQDEIPCCLCGELSDINFRTVSLSMRLCSDCFQQNKDILYQYPNWSVAKLIFVDDISISDRVGIIYEKIQGYMGY